MSTIKTLIGVAIKKQWSLFQLDISNAFLHGDLDEEAFMKLPPSLSVPASTSSSTSLVYKLQKCFYGLRQASRQWYAKLSQALSSRDDIILTGIDLTEISVLKSYLHDRFKIKDLVSLTTFLLKAKEGELLPKPEEYTSVIGKLNFLTHTRLDLSFAVQHLSQFMQQPCLPHMKATLHLLRYLKGSADSEIFYNNDPDMSLKVFYDSDWASCPNSRRSVTGFCIFLGGSLVGWKFKKQPVISLFSTEAEYRSMSKAVTEVTWLSRLFYDFGVLLPSPVPIFCDS
ncbi:PREDICTED: uncharacterized protein LOC109213666 [Nicotiana attenuata]|uniref:uncharacterized protein LOC109213666 n=1 Tax=Nicotiana attenuata TaxID=49451 RepID=UPI000905666A|nr:PREDICTED: uncharacterized protein LOC109213666 [Nicotiana attenuata]